MRHRKRTDRLSRTKSEREALLANLVKKLFELQAIETTLANAKQAQRLADKLITKGKKADLRSRRMVFNTLRDKNLTVKLFKEIAPLFKERGGGYTRVVRSRTRKGDAAQMAILELTEKKVVAPKAKPKKEKPAGAEPSPEAEKAKPSEAARPGAVRPKEALPEKHLPPKKEKEAKPKKGPVGFIGTLRKFFKGRTK